MFLIISFTLAAWLLVYLYSGQKAVWTLIAATYTFITLMHLNTFFRTKNISYFFLALAFLVIVIFCVFASFNSLSGPHPLRIPMMLLAILSLILIFYILFTKRIKWRTREMLELAAFRVNETMNGYTGRPFPIGRIDATPSEIESFAGFISKNLIAIPYRESGRIIFSLSSSYMKQNGLKRGYDDESWVAISDSGEVNVFITKEDYFQYREEFSFDQLCSNLGNLFIEFFELYMKGDGPRIMDRLNALNLNPISE
jgi:hypothetical protein